MRNGFVSEIRAPQKVILRNRLDMFSEGRVSQKRSRFACKIYGGARRGIETLTLTHDHIPIYSVYNSRFPVFTRRAVFTTFRFSLGEAIATVEKETRLRVAIHRQAGGLWLWPSEWREAGLGFSFDK